MLEYAVFCTTVAESSNTAGCCDKHSTLAQANQELRSSCSTSDEEEDERPRGVATMNGEAEEEEEGHGWPQAQSPAVRRSPLARAEPDEKLHALSIEPKPKPAPPAEQKVKRPGERLHML